MLAFRLVRAFLYVFATLLTLLIVPVEAKVLELAQSQFVLSDQQSPPAESAPWRPQTLPDIWRNTHPLEAKSGWYKLQIQHTPQPGVVNAIYLPKLDMNAEVWLNGFRLGNGGSMQDPFTRNWNHPLLFDVPQDRLFHGFNVLHIRIVGNAYTQPNLFPVQFGDAQELKHRYERRTFFNITLNQIAFVLITLIGMLMMSLWWRRRKDIAYATFGLSALMWGIQSANLFIRDVPLITQNAQWEIVINASFQIIAALLLSSILRFSGIWHSRLRPLFWLLLLGSPLSLLLAPESIFLSLTSFWHMATLVATLLTMLGTLYAAAQGSREARYLVVSLLVVVLFALHDWMLHSAHLFGLAAADVPGGDIQLLQYSAPMLFLSIGWIMTSRYLHTLEDFEQLSNELDQRVRQKQVELEASYARMREMEMSHAINAERDRIYSDLHDDVGAKLLSLVYRAESDENATLARAALQDLRDVVSQRSEPVVLDELCADWRVECENRLSEAFIKLDWAAYGDLQSTRLNPQQAVNLTRILREAVSNIIRHAQTKSAQVRIQVSAETLLLDIQDNGKGCPLVARAGRGLRSIAARAQKLNARLDRYRPESGGCGIKVHLPLSENQISK